jgi:hypothetical protein
MPRFCRHNRLIQNCPICSREQAVEMRPVLTSGTPAAGSARPRPGGGRAAERSSGKSAGATVSRRPLRGAGSRDGLRVHRLKRGAEDGYRSELVPGLKSSSEAERLAAELAFAAGRLRVLATDPPGLYAEIADPGGALEERLWLAFLTCYLGVLDEPDPFREVAAIRTDWASGALPALDGVQVGPRGAHTAAYGLRTLEAYRAWARRAGSQAQALVGEAAWTPERRFARSFERLSLGGLHRDARFELLVVLGTTGTLPLQAAALQFGGENEVTVAAKRIFGIGDPLLLERRAAELAQACGQPLAALDLALYNWERGQRHGGGLAPEHADAQPGSLESARAVLGLEGPAHTS